MSHDAFKYHNSDHYPTLTGEIKPSKKGEKYAVKFDIASDPIDSLYQFSKAYHKAADIIVKRMLSSHQIDELDEYFFPVFFLYRHSIELMLKSIGFIIIPIKTDRISFLRDTFHNLSEIYKYISEKNRITRPLEEHQWLTDYFNNISSFDKASDSFRYPFHIDVNYIWGHPEYSINRVFQSQTHIDLICEVNKMGAAFEILEMWFLDFKEPTNEHVAQEYIACNTSFLDEGGSYYEQSVVGYESRSEFYAYCSGYQECANYLKQYLIEEFDQENFSGLSHMFYPMCYLYRNDVELLLKTILFKCSSLRIDEVCKVVHSNKHKIVKLFEYIEQEVLPIYELDAQDDFIKNAKRYCNILHNFDLDSSKFRYPINKLCEPYMRLIRYYDFVELGTFLESLCNAIDGIHNEAEYRKDILAEIAAEYANYMND